MSIHERRVASDQAPQVNATSINSQALENRVLDVSIFSVLFLAPLVLGGRHPLGELALILAVLPGTLALVCKSLQGRSLPLKRWQWLLLFAFLLIPILQITSIPADYLHILAPGLKQLFPNPVSTFSGGQTPETLSISAWETYQAMPLGIALLATFLCFLSRLETSRDIDRLVILLVASGLMLTAVAIAQAKFGNGKFLWLYDHPSRKPGTVPRGPFQNENHLCSLLATLLPCTLYLVFRNIHLPATLAGSGNDFSKSFRSRWLQSTAGTRSRYRYDKRLTSFTWPQGLAIVACILIVSTVLATPSRGGVAVIVFAGITWLAFLGWSWLGLRFSNLLNYSKWMYSGLAAGTLLAICLIAAMFTFIDRFSHWRGEIWSADLQVWKSFPLLGVGIGNHRHAYHAFMEEYNPQTFSTAESSWLQVLTETGSLGLLVAIVFVATVLLAAAQYAIRQRNGSHFLLASSIFAGLSTSCLHAFGDFPWHIPACCVVVLALSAIALRLQAVDNGNAAYATSQKAISRFGGLASSGLTCAVLVGTLWAVQNALPPAKAARSWDEFRRLARDNSSSLQSDSLDPQRSQQILQLLEDTLQKNPRDLLARTTLTCYLASRLEQQQFRMQNPTKLANHILQQAEFLSSVCPAESRSYLCASIALSTQGGTLSQQEELLAQSQILRPIDGRVALKRGLNALMMSNPKEAERQFGIALNDDPTSRSAAVQAVSIIYPLEQIIDNWHPDRPTTALIYNISKREGTPDQLLYVGHYYCQRLCEEANQSQSALRDQFLEIAFDVATQIQDDALSLQILSKRLESNPRNISLLLSRAELHYAMGDEQATLADLLICQNISPHDERVRKFALRVDREAGLRIR